MPPVRNTFVASHLSTEFQALDLEELTATHGPNGNIDWMNCGLTEGGWNPPHVTVNDVVTVNLYDALKDPNSPFTACSPYIDTFYKYASQHGCKLSLSGCTVMLLNQTCIASACYHDRVYCDAGEFLQPQRGWWCG